MLHRTALILLALMTGNEVCVAAFVMPTLRSLPEAGQGQPAAKLAAVLGRWMPFVYGMSLILTGAVVFLGHRAAGAWPIRAVGSLGLQVLILIMTLGWMLPINNRLARMRTPYGGWLDEARRWDNLHRVRVVLLLVAVFALAT